MPAPKKAARTQASVPTMDDIARLAGVTASTVSRALAGSSLVNEETRARIRRLADQHGYVLNTVASGLRRRRSNVISVIIPLRHDAGQHLTDPFFMEMLAHLADTISERGYDLLLTKSNAPPAEAINAIHRSGKADGIIVIGQSLDHDQLAAVARTGVPLVVWGAKLRDQAYVSVGANNHEGGRLATAHLIDRGRRAIAFVGDCRLPELKQRHAGYTAALAAAGIKANPALTVPSFFELENALITIGTMLSQNIKFDGIVAASDVIAMAAIQALTAAGKSVPADISIVGFDDIAMAAHAAPPLTTIRQHIAQGAALLAKSMIDTIEGNPTRSTEMTPELVVRGSS